MPKKKIQEEAEISEDNFEEEESQEQFLEEASEETEIDILNVPTIISSELSVQPEDYPTDNHLACRTKYIQGDTAPPAQPTLIIRK